MSDMMDDWVMRVLGMDVRSARAGAAASATAAFTARLTAMREDMQGFGLLGDLGPDLKRAAEAVKLRDAAAAGLIDALEMRLATIAAERRRDRAQSEIRQAALGKAGVVNFAKARLKWDGARKSFHQAGTNLETAARTLVATPAFIADSRSASPALEPKLAAIAERLPNIERLAGEIEAALDAIGTAENTIQPDGSTRKDRTATAVKAIDTYLAEIAKQPMLKALQSSEAGGLPIADTIASALDALRVELAG